MGRDQDETGQFEWFNAWASLSKAEAASVEAATAAVAAIAAEKPAAAAPVTKIATIIPIAQKLADDQLMRDVAEIERTRDALATLPVRSSTRRMQALTLASAQRTDRAPVMIGGVLALVMLTVFGAAAAMSKLAR